MHFAKSTDTTICGKCNKAVLISETFYGEICFGCESKRWGKKPEEIKDNDKINKRVETI